MPARRNRPGKHGTKALSTNSLTDDEKRLVEALKLRERCEPCSPHWVSWADVNVARDLVRRGYLTEQGCSGMFQVTWLFRTTFMGWVVPP